jgi:hypothetical protein
MEGDRIRQMQTWGFGMGDKAEWVSPENFLKNRPIKIQ